MLLQPEEETSPPPTIELQPPPNKMAPPASPPATKIVGESLPPLAPLPPPTEEHSELEKATPSPSATKRVLGPAMPPPAKTVKGPTMPPPPVNTAQPTTKEKRGAGLQRTQESAKRMKRDLGEEVEASEDITDPNFVPLFQPKEKTTDKEKLLREKYGY